MLFYYIAALKNRAVFLCAHISEPVDGLWEKTTEYCKCDLYRHGKRTQIKKEDGTGDGSQNKQKTMGFAFQFLWQSQEMNKKMNKTKIRFHILK